MTSARRRKHWGWGYEDEQPSPEEVRAAAGGLATHLGFPPLEVEDPVGLDAVVLSAPRIEPPAALASICSADTHARASHALGKSYSDIVKGFRGRFDHPPDFVAHPRDETDVERLLEWCSSERVAAIPYGGGTSVVGGVEPRVDDTYNGAISIDLGALRSVVEVDQVSRAALIQGGATGPDLEAQLATHGLTLRHFPQSFELATLGGWVATRAAGHFATVWTHIEDFVESVHAITPTGKWVSRRLPGSGAGPSPDRMLVGSEGTLGIVTEAWVTRTAPPHPPRLGGGSLPHVHRRRRVRAGALPVGSPPKQLPPHRPRRGALHDVGRRHVRAARAWLRVRGSPRGLPHGPRACDLRRARRDRRRAA